jgi:hypothetical protein
MPTDRRNMGASVRARLLDRARAQQSDFQVLLTRYTLERLLYRLSVSEHRDRFILKGAMLFSIWVERTEADTLQRANYRLGSTRNLCCRGSVRVASLVGT